MGWLVCVWLASLTEQKIAVVGWTLSCLSPPADPRTLIDSILGHHISELNTYNHSQTHFLPPVPQQPLPWLFILITVCKSYQYKVTPSLTHSHILTHLSLCIGDGGGPMEYDNPMINMTIGSQQSSMGPLVLPYSQPPPSSFPSPFVPIAAQMDNIYSIDPQQQFCKHLIPV